MKRYGIITVETPEQIAEAPVVQLDCFLDSSYRPVTTAAIVYLKERGFLCRMRCRETNPRADMTQPDSDTYKDSCMEWFVNFNPALGEAYLNLEANARGTLHCKLGKDRYVRRALDEFAAERPTAIAVVTQTDWRVDYFISMKTIRSLFRVDSVRAGDCFRGNFYKCGNETSQPHYGMWNLVASTPLDFHRPDFFGTFVLL